MAVEYWSQEDLEEFYEHPEVFYNRARELRARMIYELITKMAKRITSLLK
jgi:hypothetical protein